MNKTGRLGKQKFKFHKELNKKFNMTPVKMSTKSWGGENLDNLYLKIIWKNKNQKICQTF